MKVFVSADIEGVAGITARDEAGKGKPGDAPFRAQMVALEVPAYFDVLRALVFRVGL